MKNGQQPLNDSTRHRQLDALFADEPYLSPTMKARRLHEKLQEARAKENQAAEQTTEKRREPDFPFWIGDDEETIFGGAGRGAEGSRISFAEATERLRRARGADPFGHSSSDRLHYFRTQVLSQWLKQAPRREIELRPTHER